MSSLEYDNAIYAEIGAAPIKEDFDIAKNAYYEDPKKIVRALYTCRWRELVPAVRYVLLL